MGTITTKDDTRIFYKDWGKGRPVVFSHGWPLNSDIWDEQLFHFASNGFRAVAHDRRGHGRSSQPWTGYDMDTFADDLAAMLDSLDLRDVTLVGHSMGGGEVARYLGRHGIKRVSKAVLVAAIPPLMLKTPANPGGAPVAAFDGIRAGLLANRSQFFKDLSGAFFGANRDSSKVPQGVRDQFWLLGMQAGLKGVHDCVRAFSETDFTEDLKKIDIPVLVIHGDDDQIVPIEDSAKLAVKLLRRSTLKVYEGGSHGLFATHRERFNDDLLSFTRG
jgi:non-heme chloroperoxidase